MSEFNIKFLILVVIQIILGSVLNLSQYVMITLLPTLILFLPTERSTPSALMTAFLSSLIVDFFTNGMLGLTTASLLPVALLRPLIMRALFGNELFVRGEDLSVGRQGLPKVFTAILILNAVFLALFIWFESAGTRLPGLCLIKFIVSLPLSSALSVFAANTLRSNS